MHMLCVTVYLSVWLNIMDMHVGVTMSSSVALFQGQLTIEIELVETRLASINWLWLQPTTLSTCNVTMTE